MQFKPKYPWISTRLMVIFKKGDILTQNAQAGASIFLLKTVWNVRLYHNVLARIRTGYTVRLKVGSEGHKRSSIVCFIASSSYISYK